MNETVEHIIDFYANPKNHGLKKDRINTDFISVIDLDMGDLARTALLYMITTEEQEHVLKFYAYELNHFKDAFGLSTVMLDHGELAREYQR